MCKNLVVGMAGKFCQEIRGLAVSSPHMQVFFAFQMGVISCIKSEKEYFLKPKAPFLLHTLKWKFSVIMHRFPGMATV